MATKKRVFVLRFDAETEARLITAFESIRKASLIPSAVKLNPSVAYMVKLGLDAYAEGKR